MNEKLIKRIEELEQKFKNLEADTTIPLEVGRAITERVIQENTSIPVIVASTKSATSENKAVDEAGASAYSVMNKPDGFVQFSIKETIYYIPYFS